MILLQTFKNFNIKIVQIPKTLKAVYFGGVLEVKKGNVGVIGCVGIVIVIALLVRFWYIIVIGLGLMAIFTHKESIKELYRKNPQITLFVSCLTIALLVGGIAATEIGFSNSDNSSTEEVAKTSDDEEVNSSSDDESDQESDELDDVDDETDESSSLDETSDDDEYDTDTESDTDSVASSDVVKESSNTVAAQPASESTQQASEAASQTNNAATSTNNTTGIRWAIENGYTWATRKGHSHRLNPGQPLPPGYHYETGN